MQHTRTLAYLAALVAAATIVISHSSYATQILEETPAANSTSNKVFTPRTLPVKRVTPTTEKKDSTSSLPAVKTSGINDAFRLESLGVVRLLTKTEGTVSRTTASGSVQEAIRTFISAQEKLRKELNALPSGNVMGRSVRNGKVNAIVDAYREALRPSIASGKQEQFSGFIMNKRIQLQSQYEKIRAKTNAGETIKAKVKANTTR